MAYVHMDICGLPNKIVYPDIFSDEGMIEYGVYLIDISATNDYLDWLLNTAYGKNNLIIFKSNSDIETLANHISQYFIMGLDEKLSQKIDKGATVFLDIYKPSTLEPLLRAMERKELMNFFKHIDIVLFEDEYQLNFIKFFIFNNGQLMEKLVEVKEG